jgi:hypothetical protein
MRILRRSGRKFEWRVEDAVYFSLMFIEMAIDDNEFDWEMPRTGELVYEW